MEKKGEGTTNLGAKTGVLTLCTGGGAKCRGRQVQRELHSEIIRCWSRVSWRQTWDSFNANGESCRPLSMHNARGGTEPQGAKTIQSQTMIV